MLPPYALDNSIGRAPVYAGSARNLAYGYAIIMLLAHLTYKRFGETGVAVIFAARQSFRVLCRKAIHAAIVALRMSDVSVSSLCNTVLHVFAVRAKPKMIGVTTRRVVARVAHLHPWGNKAICQFPRYLVRTSQAVSMIYSPVVFAVARALPFPAIAFGHENTRPQAIFNWLKFALKVALATAKKIVACSGAKEGSTRFARVVRYATMCHVGTPIKYRPCARLLKQRGRFVLRTLYHIPQQEAI